MKITSKALKQVVEPQKPLCLIWRTLFQSGLSQWRWKSIHWAYVT